MPVLTTLWFFTRPCSIGLTCSDTISKKVVSIIAVVEHSAALDRLVIITRQMSIWDVPRKLQTCPCPDCISSYVITMIVLNNNNCTCMKLCGHQNKDKATTMYKVMYCSYIVHYSCVMQRVCNSVHKVL